MDNLEGLGPTWKPLRWLMNTGPGNFTLWLVTMTVICVSQDIGRDALTLRTFLPSGIVLFGMSVAMTIKYGNPLNWWIPFFGVTQTVDTKKLVAREMSGEESEDIRKEIAEWVKTCSKSRYHRVNPYRYKFLRKGDAAMFKLAWG